MFRASTTSRPSPRPARRTSGFLGDLRGAALVEFTLVAPFLIFLSIGLFEFGRALQHHHVVNKGVRDAARYLARVEATCSGASGSITNAADITRAQNLAMTGFIAGGQPILDYWTNPASVQVAVGCVDNGAGTFRGQAEIPVVTVTAQVTYQDLGLLDALGLAAPAFQAAHQELHIGE